MGSLSLVNLSRKGVLVIRVKAEAHNGLQSVSRVLEVRKIVRMSVVSPGYRDAITGDLMELDVSLKSVMDPGWRPKKLDVKTPGSAGGGIDPSRYMLDISPFDQVRTVVRDA